MIKMGDMTKYSLKALEVNSILAAIDQSLAIMQFDTEGNVLYGQMITLRPL